MKDKVKVTFEVTKDKTIVTTEGRNGSAMRKDITGSIVEDKFISLLKIIQVGELIGEATDISTWEQVAGPKI